MTARAQSPLLLAALLGALLAALLLAWSPGVSAQSAELNGDMIDPVDADQGPATAYYRWIDGSGRIQYTDFEPVGVPSELIPLTPEVDEDAPMLSVSNAETPSDPFNDQDQQVVPIEHIGPCADARRQLGILYAALPVYQDASGEYRSAWRGDSYKGDRAYLDADARTAAIARTRSTVLEHCSDPEAFAREEAAFDEEVGRN